jgi:hypothetical protein
MEDKKTIEDLRQLLQSKSDKVVIPDECGDSLWDEVLNQPGAGSATNAADSGDAGLKENKSSPFNQTEEK